MIFSSTLSPETTSEIPSEISPRVRSGIPPEVPFDFEPGVSRNPPEVYFVIPQGIAFRIPQRYHSGIPTLEVSFLRDSSRSYFWSSSTRFPLLVLRKIFRGLIEELLLGIESLSWNSLRCSL